MAKKEITNDDLAMMVQNGFMEVKEEIQDVRDELKSEIGEVKENVAFLSMKMVFQQEFTRLEKRVKALEKEKQVV